MWIAFLFVIVPQPVFADIDIDSLLSQAARQLDTGPEAAKENLKILEDLEVRMSDSQRATYFKLMASSFAFRGMNKEQVETSKKALEVVDEPNLRASLLYYLSDGYSNLGEYEKSLEAMNESILILPKVTDLEARIEVLQSAFSLLESLHAYEESASYAERLTSLPSNGSSLSACVGLADLIELAFLQHKGGHARSLLVEEEKACVNHNVIRLSMRALDLADQLSSSSNNKTLSDSIDLLSDLMKDNERSDYSIQLADAIAKRYLALGQLSKAEQYGMRAVQWANAGNAILLQQQTSDTLASVMRAEGRLDQALKYLDISNALWAKLLEQRSRKDLAYQQMKFRSQDQSNQLKLLGQINSLLTKEGELQSRNKHILELLVFVTGLLLAFVSVSLLRTWRQKNDFKTYSQTDGLTKISNRSHFIACAHEAFKDARGSISVILFDMDEFKLINDTYSHAAGDWVLKTISSTIAGCLRSHDMFGRLGGEEFAICLPRASEQEALALAERCRAAIEAIDSTPSGHQFTLSASFGIAVRPPGGVAGFEEVLAAADRVLYQAKHMGRNRIVPFGEVHGHAPLVA
jgi:diguanylate cyclase (GGDEF)-like protein